MVWADLLSGQNLSSKPSKSRFRKSPEYWQTGFAGVVCREFLILFKCRQPCFRVGRESWIRLESGTVPPLYAWRHRTGNLFAVPGATHEKAAQVFPPFRFSRADGGCNLQAAGILAAQAPARQESVKRNIPPTGQAPACPVVFYVNHRGLYAHRKI